MTRRLKTSLAAVALALGVTVGIAGPAHADCGMQGYQVKVGEPAFSTIVYLHWARGSTYTHIEPHSASVAPDTDMRAVLLRNSSGTIRYYYGPYRNNGYPTLKDPQNRSYVSSTVGVHAGNQYQMRDQTRRSFFHQETTGYVCRVR